MASNVGITLAQIRAGTAAYQMDGKNSVPGVAAVQKALKLSLYYPHNTALWSNFLLQDGPGFSEENMHNH